MQDDFVASPNVLATFSEATIQQACQVIQPLSKVALTGDIRRIADVRNLELQSPRADRFHRVYRGEHIRTRDKVILHLYDLSASDDARPDRLASREFEALQKLQHLACVPRLMDSFHEVVLNDQWFRISTSVSL